MPQRGQLVRGLGPLAATALVAGNIIGTGVYVVPGSLAEIAGPLSLAAWALNVIGVRAGGGAQVATVVLKVAPLLLVTGALLFRADAGNLVPFAPHGFGGLLPAIALVSFLFLGAESATVPAEEIRGSGVTIRK